MTNKLEAPFEAQFIRLVPRKFINYPSLRWAVNGCPPPSMFDYLKYWNLLDAKLLIFYYLENCMIKLLAVGNYSIWLKYLQHTHRSFNMCILNTFAEYCTPEALVSGETSIQDWAIRASSLKGSTPYDVRLNKLPGKADPKGWLASMPQSTDRTTLSEEWIQVLLAPQQ